MFHWLPTLLNARLSRRIVLWVFASIILIEIIILIPSVLRRERELLDHISALSEAQVSGALAANPPQSAADILAALRSAQGDRILGGALYYQDGRFIDSFGDPPKLSFEQTQRGKVAWLDRQAGRYDALWEMPPVAEEYRIIIRHSANVRQEFLEFIIRIAGLVVIISIFVTLATMVVLNRLLIHPIMRLRRDLRRVGQALSQDKAAVPPLPSIDRHREDELGDVMATFEQMVRQIAEAIAHRGKIEAELRLSEEKFSKAFRASPDAVIISTLKEGRLLEVNQTFLSVAGLTHGAVINRTVDELGFWVNPGDRQAMIRLLQHQGVVRNQEYQFRTADGRVRTALYSAEKIMLEDTACILSVINDITERKQAEEALKESENRFRALIAQAVDALFVVDQAGRLIDVNQQACRNLGYSREQLLERSVTDIQVALAPADFDGIWQQLASGQSMTVEGTHRRQDGSTFPVEVRLGLIQISGRQLILALARDITERRAAEAAIARLAEIGELSSMIVHEVRNPLTTVIMGLSSFKRLDLPERARMRLDLALEESARLQRLLNEILMYARELQVEQNPVNLVPLCQEIHQTLSATPALSDRSIQFQVLSGNALTAQSDKGAIVTMGDRDKLKQVFINLVTNACEASPIGAVVLWRLQQQERQIVVQVHNGGDPIPPDVLPRLTEPFFTTKPSGNGLGLAITKRIINAHGGELVIESSAEVGTTVTVTLQTGKRQTG